MKRREKKYYQKYSDREADKAAPSRKLAIFLLFRRERN